MAESGKDEHNKTDKLSNIVIYKIKERQVEELKSLLSHHPFRNVVLNYDDIETDFELTLYTVVRESKDKLVKLLKKHIPADEYSKTYTRDNYILIARSKKDAFAICTGKAYLHILPFADMSFAFKSAKAFLDPHNITQIKCRYLNGTTVRDDRYYHKSTPGLNRALYLHNIFFIVDEFQSTIAPVNETNYCTLTELTLNCKVKVKKSNLTFCKSLSLKEILDLMHALSNLKKKDTDGFEFLDVARLIKEKELISVLDKELGNELKVNNELNKESFYLCPDNEKWAKCLQVNLKKKNEKRKQRSWKGQPHISVIIDELGNENPDSFELAFKANRKLGKYDNLINYVHGSVVHDKQRYFHVGKNWYSVDERHIESIEKSFSILMREKLIRYDVAECLPLPWHSGHGNQGTIDAEHCIRFCRDIFKKTVEKADKLAIKRIIPSECALPPEALRAIIGEAEYELYKQSLEKVDEGKYNEAYISLDKIWRKNTSQGPVPTFLVGDKILVKNVELFDILRNSDQAVYLYHVKEGFGQKTRDAASQIRISASQLYKSVSHITGANVLDEWYDCVIQYKCNDKARLKQKEHQKETIENKEKCTRLKQKEHLKETVESKEKFKELFHSKTTIYVYAFLDDLKVDRFQKEKSPGSRFEATCVTRSYIAMAELLWLAEEFEKNYPSFKLKFCQIRKPWRSDDHSKSASDSSKVIKPPKIPAPRGIKIEPTHIETLSEILTRLESSILKEKTNMIVVDRNNILDGGFCEFGSSFEPWRKLFVKFQGEDGIDAGGLGREFMRLALRAIKQLPIFIGPDNEKRIQYNEQCFAEEQYFKAGQMLAYFIVHRGPCPNFFHQTLYNELAKGITPIQIIPNEINKCEQVEMIAVSSNEEGFKAAVPKAEERSTLGKREQPTSRSATKSNSAALFEQKSMEEFKKGLQTMSILDEVKKNKKQWKKVFIFSMKVLSALQLEQLFVVNWSERREIEETTFNHWKQFLKDIEGRIVLHSVNEVPLTLEDLLVFATGADQVPLLGFPKSPQLSFRHPEDLTDGTMSHTVNLPFASTCTMELKIPVLHDYEQFRENMRNTISYGTTFTTE